MKSLACLILLLFVRVLTAQDETGGDSFPKYRFRALLDGRFIAAGDELSWLDGGFGKARYGGEDGDSQTLLRLSQVSGLASISFNESISARLHLNIDAEPDRELDRFRIDVIEAIAAYRTFIGSSARLRLRGGIFFPPVSLENTGPAWTTPYSITSSAINSWIGEEVRATGAEVAITFTGTGNEITLFGSLFGMNDPSGTLLAWRGWSLQDRQSGYSDRLPLPPIEAITPEGLFPRQPPYVEPFRELDGKAGYYAGGQWTLRNIELSGIFYDNRGDPQKFDGVQYGWDTDFFNLGVHLRLPANVEILGQYMRGDTQMGFNRMVDAGFYSGYVLASILAGRQRFTLRHDRFEVEDNDAYKVFDDNREDGSAWTAAYIFEFTEDSRLAFEFLRIDNDRPARADAGLPVDSTELVFQISFRIIL